MSISVSCGAVADKMKNLITRLGKRGPHRVMVGDLNFAGIPGRVYTPAEGNGIPGIAFGHDWRVGVDAYHATLRHLASWGFAVAWVTATSRCSRTSFTWLATAWALRLPCWLRRAAATVAS